MVWTKENQWFQKENSLSQSSEGVRWSSWACHRLTWTLLVDWSTNKAVWMSLKSILRIVTFYFPYWNRTRHIADDLLKSSELIYHSANLGSRIVNFLVTVYGSFITKLQVTVSERFGTNLTYCHFRNTCFHVFLISFITEHLKVCILKDFVKLNFLSGATRNGH